MRKMHLKILAFAIFGNLFLTLAGCQVFQDKKGIERSFASEAEAQAVAVANKEAVKLNYDLADFIIKIDRENSIWQNYISKGNLLEMIIDLKSKLSNKEFWAVYYEPKVIQMGGDLFVFVDKNTHEVITVLRGQ